MKINLNFNGIRGNISLNFENLQPLDNYTLYMDNNPYDCSCHMQKLYQLEKDFHQVNLRLDNARCSWPGFMGGRSVNMFKNFLLRCANFECLMSCTCLYRNFDNYLVVNCSNMNIEIVPHLKIIEDVDDLPAHEFTIQSDKIQLNFENNLLRKLPIIPIDYEYQVVELLAANNSLEELSVENLRNSLKILDLRNNNLRSLNADVVDKVIKMQTVYLGGNPWLCDCSTIEFFRAIKLIKEIVVDYENLYCDNHKERLADLNSINVCFELIYIVSILGIAFGIVGIISGLFYKYKKDIKIFLYAHDMCLWFVTEEELDEDKVYDAFFCFAALDQPLVEDLILDLEKDPNNFKLLVGIRDWLPGHWFPELVSVS